MRYTKKIFFVLLFVALFIVVPAHAQTLPVQSSNTIPAGSVGGTQTIELPNPLGISNINDLINKIIDGLIIFATPVAVAMVIWAAYLFMSSGGDPKKLTTAKSALLWTVVGYAILLLAKGVGLIIQNFLSQ